MVVVTCIDILAYMMECKGTKALSFPFQYAYSCDDHTIHQILNINNAANVERFFVGRTLGNIEILFTITKLLAIPFFYLGGTF